MGLRVLIVPTFLLAVAGLAWHARAQPATDGQTAGRCAVVCPPETVLDRKTCTCEAPRRHPPCALVCLGPDQTLDAEHCRCVGLDRPFGRN